MGGGSLPQTITFQQNPLRTFDDPCGNFPVFTKESFNQWISQTAASTSGFTEASLNYLVTFDSPWQVIGSNVFKDLSNIDISNGQSLTDIFEYKEALTDISASAFENMGLSGGLDFSGFSALETIGNSAFGNNPNLTSVNLKNNALKTIGNSAFVETGLTELDLSGLNTLETIGDSAFFDRPLEPLNLTGLTNLKTIGDYAFDTNIGRFGTILTSNLSELTNLESIGSSAFGGVAIGALEISGLNSLKTIGDSAFYGTGDQIYGVLLQNLPDLSSIGNNAFNDQLINDIIIINCPSLNNIGNDCFTRYFDYSSNNLTLRGVPSLTSFPHQAFHTASFEGSLELTGTGFTEITDDFSNGSFAGSLIINDNQDLSSINENAFYNTNFTSLELSGNTALKTIKAGSFSSANYINGVTFTNSPSLTNIEGSSDINKQGAFFRSDINGPLDFKPLIGLQRIGASGDTNGAFENNISITTIDFSGLSSLEIIGDRAFSKQGSETFFESVNFSNCPSLQVIKTKAFETSNITDTTIVTFKDNSGLIVEAGAFNAAGNYTSDPGDLSWNDPSDNSLTIPDAGLYVFDFDPSPL